MERETLPICSFFEIISLFFCRGFMLKNYSSEKAIFQRHYLMTFDMKPLWTFESFFSQCYVTSAKLWITIALFARQITYIICILMYLHALIKSTCVSTYSCLVWQALKKNKWDGSIKIIGKLKVATTLTYYQNQIKAIPKVLVHLFHFFPFINSSSCRIPHK